MELNIVIKEFVEELKDRIRTELCDDINLAFITGSYVRKKHFSDEPNVNIYLVSKEGNFYKANLLYAKIVSELIGKWNHGVEIFVDLHPYAYSRRDTSKVREQRISLTTNMFDGSAKKNRLNLTQNIGNGWNYSYEVIYGDEKILKSLLNVVEKNDSWWDEREYALLLYKYQLEKLPHIYSLEESPLIIFREALHYAEEAIRDSVSLKLEPKALAEGDDLNIIHDWRNKLIPFYQQNYPSEVFDLVTKFTELKYSEFNFQCERENAINCYSWAIVLLDEMLNEYYRLRGISKGVLV
ncbi:hypothetical protein JOC85_003084 [Bacillus mesophilus]|uniref:Nucleotidyltransferase n=1 Tax=Bacillus mesophilus TaxID=1808955 RepID=A0A6M0QDB9_9BACI|nr:hypothetical protein [Bacillus mesophilus]MBM7662277.1 hypothetical protein [Bacillus mesophilus]NEY73088.1 hypothetical protein [Bacillus mesophilus]